VQPPQEPEQGQELALALALAAQRQEHQALQAEPLLAALPVSRLRPEAAQPRQPRGGDLQARQVAAGVQAQYRQVLARRQRRSTGSAAVSVLGRVQTL